MELGPVEYILVAFPSARPNADVAPALADLIESGTIRVIDLAFVSKTADGEMSILELGELAPDVQAVFDAAGIEVNGLLNDDDLQAAAEALEPDMSAALLVWEDLWAAKFTSALRASNGVLLERRLIPHEDAQAAHDFALGVGADILADR